MRRPSWRVRWLPGFVYRNFRTGSRACDAHRETDAAPTILGGVSLTINGIVAPLYFVGPNQVNAQIPYEVAPGQATAVLTIAGSDLPAAPLTVKANAPGIFINSTNYALVRNADNSVNSALNSAAVGSIVMVYGTGQGQVDNPVPTGAVAYPPHPYRTWSAARRLPSAARTLRFRSPGLRRDWWESSRSTRRFLAWTPVNIR